MRAGSGLLRPLLEKAREIREAQLGADHSQVALVTANLQRLERASAELARGTAAAAAHPSPDAAVAATGEVPDPTAGLSPRRGRGG